jgi:cyclopropane fatty-acyl-phospholipid synthase-like methyltransferase
MSQTPNVRERRPGVAIPAGRTLLWCRWMLQGRAASMTAGRWQNTQRFYEDAATACLARAGEFARAGAVFEPGCGTGRFAAGLFTDYLSVDARYVGVDVSPVMVQLARQRLAQWGTRAEVQLLEPPSVMLPGADASFDRFVATYVFDLVADRDARTLIDEAHRLLAPGGLLALVSLTHRTTAPSRLIAGGWDAIARRWTASWWAAAGRSSSPTWSNRDRGLFASVRSSPAAVCHQRC